MEHLNACIVSVDLLIVFFYLSALLKVVEFWKLFSLLGLVTLLKHVGFLPLSSLISSFRT